MTDAPVALSNSEPPLAREASPLLTDVPCARCSYNLRGLTADMNCPECGTPVSRSSMGNWLQFADPEWVGKLRRGMSLKLWNIAVALLMGVVVGIVGAAFGQSHIAGMLMALLGGLLGTLAVFLITTPEPTVGTIEETVTLRKAIRVSAIAGLGLNVFQQSNLLGRQALLTVLLGLISGAVGLVLAFGEMVYLRRFARRIPDPVLANRTGTVLYGQIAATALFMTAGLLVVISLVTSGTATWTGGVSLTASSAGVTTTKSSTGSPGPFVVAAAILGGLGGILFLIFGIWYLILVTRYRRAFLEAEKEAIALSHPARAATVTAEDITKLSINR